MARTSDISHTKLQKYADDFIASLVSRETQGTYGRALKDFLRWQRLDATSFPGTDNIQRYLLYLINEKKLLPASVATYLSAVRRLCEHLVHAGVLPANPANGVSCPPATRAHTHGTLSAEEIDTLFLVIDRSNELGLRDAAILRIMVTCGLTPVELIRADVGDVTLDVRYATLAVQRKGRKEKDTIIALPAVVKHALRAYLDVRSQAKKSEPLFESSSHRTRGDRMTPRGLRSRISLYLAKAGIISSPERLLSPISLRHSAVALSIAHGATIEQVRSKFHIGTDTTAKLYITTA